MKILKPALLALLAGFALASPARATERAELLPTETFLLVMPDGHIARMPVKDKATLDMVMKEATEVKAGQVFLLSGGKLYMAQDKKMPDGKMLFEHTGYGG